MYNQKNNISVFAPQAWERIKMDEENKIAPNEEEALADVENSAVEASEKTAENSAVESDTKSDEKQDAKPDEKPNGETDEKPPKPMWKKIVGAALSLIPALVCLLTIVLSTHMNGLSLSNLTVEDRWIVIISFVLLALSTVVGILRPRLPKAVGWVIWALAPAGVMLLAEWIIRDPFSTNSSGEAVFSVALILLNIAIYYITAAFFLFITRNTFVSIVAASWFPLALAVANHYVQLFRGTVLFPWDIQSIGVAATVVGNYEFDFPVVVAFVIECFVVIWQLSYFSRVKFFRSFKKMIVSFVCALICLAMGIGYAAYMRTDDLVDRFKIYPYLFTPNAVYNHDGMMVSLLFSLKFMGVEKPEGYSEEAVAALADEYAEKADAAEADVKPNIIAIMNEAWSDLSVLAPFETNLNVFPNTSRMTENVVRGHMYMSVVGGNTANSEFEFLTSSSMGFLPPGSVPYQLIIKYETPSLVTSLEEQGYQSVAMHPYYASGWDRDKVYPFFSFDDTYFIDSFSKSDERLRSYISDRAMFRKIEKVYEERDKSKPFFLFGVTMQNHGGYSGHSDFSQPVAVTGLEKRASLSQYLSLIRETDIAFGELVDYFTEVDEPTIILMFGDHQPGEFVSAPLYTNAGLTYPPESFEEQQNKFIVPFIMWANYDIEEKDDVLTSPNYLSILLCETAGLKLTPYQKYLRELKKDYPVVTANFAIDAAGKFYPNNEMKTLPGIKEYSMIQYNHIIDYKNRAENMYTTVK